MAKHHKKTTPRWSTPQWVLAIGLAAFAIATLAALVVQWPHSDEEPKVTPAYQNSGYAGPLTSGEVLFTRAAKCGATEIGVTSEAIPEDKNPFAEKHCTQVIVRLTDGADEGKYTALESRHMPGEPELHEGDSIKLIHSHGTYAFQDYDRTGPLWAWVLATIVLIIAVGRWRGLRALVGLAITMVMILVFLLPALLRGGSPLWLAVTTAATVILLVVFLVHGVNWKSAAAMGGSLVAVAIATALSGLAIDSTSLRGLGDESNLQILLYLPELDITGLMLAGMIIGALGVLNDATIAQASTITELKRAEPDASSWQLFRNAMRVGEDHIASMVYTLVLGYAGVAIPMMLLLSISGRPVEQVLTSDVMATELLRSVTGAIALLLAIPLTTAIAAVTADPNSRDSGHAHIHSH